MGANRDLHERFVAHYNAGELDGCMRLYADNAVHARPDGQYAGRAEIRERLARELVAFPDARYTVGRFVEQGAAFATEFTFAGTHNGPFTLPDGTKLPPTGRRIEVGGVALVQVRDGLIAVDNLYYDATDALAQLGLAWRGAAA